MNIFKELLDAFNFKLWIQKKQEAKRAQDILKLIRSREQEIPHGETETRSGEIKKTIERT
jgi:hypothetical protein